MPDGLLGNIPNVIAAVAALGTAAMGLVDASKAFWGGISRLGFGYIWHAVRPFLGDGGGKLGAHEVRTTLLANWLNGVPMAEQKAKVKALVHLKLTTDPARAEALAGAAGVEATGLAAVARKTVAGEAPTEQEIATLGQFDAVLSAVLDAAYERADQKYRNATKVASMFCSAVLAVIGGRYAYNMPWEQYLGSQQLFTALIVGIGATPLAPVAKDLTSTLQAAVKALSVVKR